MLSFDLTQESDGRFGSQCGSATRFALSFIDMLSCPAGIMSRTTSSAPRVSSVKIDLEQAASTLVRDHAHKSNIVPFARAWGAADLAGAYAIQAAFVERMVATHGPRVGYKIGLTSARMQKMCSIDHPVAGVVLRNRMLPSGARLKLSDLVHLGIEFEICVRLGRSLAPRTTPATGWSMLHIFCMRADVRPIL